MLAFLTSFKKQQRLLKLAVDRNSEEIMNLKEYLGRKPKDPIVMLNNFNTPKFPIDRVESINLMNSACQNIVYRDQIVRYFN